MSSSDGKKTCSNKSCRNEGVKKCTKCKIARYCCRDCQVDHWKTHRRLCGVLTCPQKHARYLQAHRHIKDGHDLVEKKQYDESLVEYRKAAAIYQEILGGNDESTAKCYDCIGLVFQLKGQTYDALIVCGKALAIRLRLFGENHISVAYSNYSVGVSLLQKGQFNDALVSLRKAHDIFLRDYGELYPQTIDTSRLIENVLQMKQKRDKANDFLSASLVKTIPKQPQPPKVLKLCAEDYSHYDQS